MTIAAWVDKYGKIVGYTTAVILVTGFLIRFDQKFSDGNRALVELNSKVAQLTVQVNALQALLQDREKYDRWNRGYNSRMKRLFNKQGWEYEVVE